MNPTIKLELSNEALAVIGAALGNHPYRVAAPVIAELQRQIDAQAPKPAGMGNGSFTVEPVPTEDAKSVN